MKRLSRTKLLKQSTGFILACLLLAGVVFLFTQPLLAPETEEYMKRDKAEIAGVENNLFESTETNQKVAQGIKAESFLVFDQQTGKILAAKNSKTPVAIASITKLMTAYVTQKHGELEDRWAITNSSTGDIRPLLGLKIGDRVIVKDLVNAMLIGSANDAAAALGAYLENVSGKSAQELMNQEAKALGMNSTHYENPIGFDSEQNYSTAEDLRLLILKTSQSELFTAIDRKSSYTFTSEVGNQYSIKATNTLLETDPDLHAIKTGFTDEAEGAMITAVHTKDHQFIMIILRSPDRESDTKTLKTNILKTITE